MLKINNTLFKKLISKGFLFENLNIISSKILIFFQNKNLVNQVRAIKKIKLI